MCGGDDDSITFHTVAYMRPKKKGVRAHCLSLGNHSIFSTTKQSQREKHSQQAATTIMYSCFKGQPSATSLLEAVQATQTSTLSQHHHSLMNTQANNLLGAHDLNTTRDFGSAIVR
uniref:Uncharacterized protein n=1 Tax=Brassica campestris TaxID=3711 RepID=M4ESP2_BRACM